MPTKTELRERFRSYRESLDEVEYMEKSAMIIDRALAIPQLQKAGTVHAYWPMIARREIDIRPLIEEFCFAGRDVALPCVTESAMEHRLYSGVEECLVCSAWGIHEPVDEPLVAPDAIDVVIVPALGAGLNGHRIGYGRGFYDAFLAATDALRICFVYQQCVIDSVEPEAHDQAMDMLVTEMGVIHTNQDL